MCDVTMSLEHLHLSLGESVHPPIYPPIPSPRPSRDVLPNLCPYLHRPRKQDRHLHLAELLVGLLKGARV